MPSPYFVNVDPSPAKLRMFFGRQQEIQTINNYLRNGDSVLLIGERRIGKTFLLYMIGDFARGGVDFCEQLLDRRTGAFLAELRNSTAVCHWPYVDMLAVTSVSGFYFKVLTELAEEHTERFATPSSINHMVFLKELTRLSEDLSSRGQRAIVLVDEGEKLLGLDESAEVFSCLKAVIQQCEAVDFILAGDIKPHQETTEFMNLKGTLRPIYLAPLDPIDAQALIQVPVEGHLSFEEQVLQRILELTGGKPSLLQILCGHLCELLTSEDTGLIRVTLATFDRLWESRLCNKVFESFEAPLWEFFNGLQGNERDIFCFLAHHPLATTDDIAKALGIHRALAQRCLSSLQRTHRIRETESGFHIGAKVVEEFGSRFVPPVAKPPQPLADMLTGENAAREYKASMRWDLHTQQVNKALEKVVAKTVAGFLNSEGGALLIGVADNCTVLGIEHDLKTIDHKDIDGYERALRQVLTSALGAEFSQYQHVSFEEIEGKTICIVRVEPSPKPVYLTDKGTKEFYIRVGPATQPLDMETAYNYISMHWPV